MPFYKSLSLPMNLQFFAEGGEGDPPNDPPTDPPAEPPNDPPDEETFSKEYVEKLRKEAAKYRTKAKEQETNSQQKQQDMMKKIFAAFGLEPDPDKEFEKQLSEAQTKAQAAEQKANERLIRAEVKMKSAELGIIDDEAAFALMVKENVKVNDDGSVEGVEGSLKALLENKPFLKGEVKRNIGTGSNPGSGNGSLSDEEWGKEQAKKRSEQSAPAAGFNPWG